MKKRIFALILCIAIAASSLSGCSSPKVEGETSTTSPKGTQTTSDTPEAETSNVTPAGEFPIVKEKITLSVVTPDKAYLAALSENFSFKWLEEKSNIHLEFEEIPPEAKKEKINLMLVSGELPDILLGCGITAEQQVIYGSQNVFMPLNDMIEKYGVETKKVFDEYKGSKEYITAPDGNIYGLPSINDAYHTKMGQRAWINQEWLTKLNLKMPTTTVEFEDVLQAFKTKDPNGNGKADEIAMMGGKAYMDNVNLYPFLMCAFTYQFGSEGVSANAYLDENKKIVFTANTPEFKEGLKWIRSLVEKGLIDPTSFTQDLEQYKQVAQDPNGARIGVATAFTTMNVFGQDKDTADMRHRQYEALPPLQGPAGFRVIPHSYNKAISGSSMFVITNKCKNPEAAFRLGDFAFSEESTMAFWIGEEGVSWKPATAGQTGLNGEPALYEKIDSPNQPAEINTNASNIWGNNSARLREGAVTDYSLPDTKWQLEPRLYKATKESYQPYAKPEMTVPSLFFTKEDATVYASISTQIDDYIKENVVAFLIGSLDVEKDWDKYVKEFDVLQLSKKLELMQKTYDRQYK